MFQGKCKIWREGDVLKATMELPTPSGPIVWEEKVPAPVEDPTVKKNLEKQAAFVAGFFPTETMVGSEAMEEADALYGAYLNPSTRYQVTDRVNGLLCAGEFEDDYDHDVAYALRRIVSTNAESVGWSLKKTAKKLGRAAKKVGKVAVVAAVPPVAAIALVKAAKGGNRKAAKKIAAIKKVAETPPAMTAAIVKSEGAPVSITEANAVKEQAEVALSNLQNAAVLESTYSPPVSEESFDSYDDSAGPQIEEGPWEATYVTDDSSEDEVAGMSPFSLYRDGIMAGDEPDMTEDELAGLFDLTKKIGRKIDITKKGSPFRAAVAMTPGLGPAVLNAADLAAAAKKGVKSAQTKVKTIKDLANAGVPKAKEAETNLKKGLDLVNKTEQKGFLDKIADFFRNLFGAKKAA